MVLCLNYILDILYLHSLELDWYSFSPFHVFHNFHMLHYIHANLPMLPRKKNLQCPKSLVISPNIKNIICPNLFNAWIKLQRHKRDLNSLGTRRKLNVHKMLRRRTGRLLDILCLVNFRSVSVGTAIFEQYKKTRRKKFVFTLHPPSKNWQISYNCLVSNLCEYWPIFGIYG